MVTKQNRRWVLGLAAMLATAGIGGGLFPAQAHEGKCPVCKLDVPQDTEQQDNEVALKFGRKRIEYRCVWCALTDAKTIQGDVTVLAPSEIKGKPVTLVRKADQWSAAPEAAVFVATKVNHRQCQVGYRAFTNPNAAEAYIKKNAAVVGETAKPQTLAQLLETVKAPAKENEK